MPGCRCRKLPAHSPAFDWTLNGAHYSAQFTPAGDTLCYTLQMDAPNPTQLRMWLAVPGQSDYFHVIPCNIYGDNHAAEAKPGEFPLLTKDHHEVAFCAPLWEFRADRAAMPLAALCWDGGWPPLRWNPTAKARPGSSATVCLPLCRMRSASAWGTPTTPPPSKTAPPRRRPPAAWPARRRPAAGSTCAAAREPSCMRSSGRNTPATRTAPFPQYPAPGRAGYAGHLCLPEL